MFDALMKKCQQCGEIKPFSSYRKYYRSSGYYTKCKDCERINSREKYLRGKAKLNDDEQSELDKIYKLWDAQRSKGLRPPRSRKKIDLDNMLSQYISNGAPHELTQYLSMTLDLEPEVYYNTYDEYLAPKFRPVTGVDPVTLAPIHDETYTEILRQILKRFDEYENEYYKED